MNIDFLDFFYKKTHFNKILKPDFIIFLYLIIAEFYINFTAV